MHRWHFESKTRSLKPSDWLDSVWQRQLECVHVTAKARGLNLQMYAAVDQRLAIELVVVNVDR